MNFKALMTMPAAWDKFLGHSIEMLRSNCIDLEIIWSDEKLPQNRLIELLEGKHAYMICLDTVDKTVIDACKDLKILARHGIGLDNIDIKAATQAHIAVCNTPGSNCRSVADLTCALILALSRNITKADASIRSGKFVQLMGNELSGKILGIIGFGHIGKQVATRALGFGMNVCAYDNQIDTAYCAENNIEPTSLESLFSTSDYITIHVPLTAQTKNMINAATIAKMANHAVVINVARGGIVDEDAIANALIAGNLGGYGCDVFADEPPIISDKLFQAPNTLFTAHMGGSTEESIARSAEMAAQNIIDVLNGKRVDSIVNKEICI